MSNGEMILSIFPNVEVKFYKNLSDMRMPFGVCGQP